MERAREWQPSHQVSRCFSQAISTSIALETPASVASTILASCSSTSSDSRVLIFAHACGSIVLSPPLFDIVVNAETPERALPIEKRMSCAAPWHPVAYTPPGVPVSAARPLGGPSFGVDHAYLRPRSLSSRHGRVRGPTIRTRYTRTAEVNTEFRIKMSKSSVV